MADHDPSVAVHVADHDPSLAVHVADHDPSLPVRVVVQFTTGAQTGPWLGKKKKGPRERCDGVWCMHRRVARVLLCLSTMISQLGQDRNLFYASKKTCGGP